MRYVVEMELIPCTLMSPKFPTTKRHIIEAESIGEAITIAESRFAPGADCVSFKVSEVTS